MRMQQRSSWKEPQEVPATRDKDDRKIAVDTPQPVLPGKQTVKSGLNPMPLTQSGAVICGAYRYLLWRTWNSEGPGVTFVMLNPSTADATANDPTIRRCINFAQAWLFGSLSVVNLFAYCSPSPHDLTTVADPVGPENDAYLMQAAEQSVCVIAAWGCHGRYRGRDREVMDLLSAYTDRLFCLGYNADTTPKHPLYIKNGTERQSFDGKGQVIR